MRLDQVLGQADAVDTLTRALASGRAHHAYRFEGPEGVGKELAAFAFAQAMTCTEGDALGCGVCNGCRRATTLSDEAPHVPLHPDVVLLQRGLYVDILRDDKGKKNEEKIGISVDQIRKIVLAQVGYPPYEARARMFIIRDADELTPNAANALLKTLEEPRAATHFILLTSRAGKLLPTIRSRTVPVRFGPLPTEVLVKILIDRGVAEASAREATSLAHGSVTRAREALDEDGGKRRAFVNGALQAAASKDLSRALSFAERVDTDRNAFRQQIIALASQLETASRASAERKDARALAALSHGYEVVMAVATDLEMANASPVLSMSRMLILLGRTGAARAALA